MVLNVGGSALTHQGKAGYGWLVRNFEENFQFAFYGNVGLSNILNAEIHALMIGIKLCCEAGYKKLVCFSDSLHVVVVHLEALSLYEPLGAHSDVFG